MRKIIVVGLVAIAVLAGNSHSEAYFDGELGRRDNYCPLYAHMGYETYVDLSSIYIVHEDDTWLKFNVLFANAPENADEIDKTSIARYRVNKATRQAWIWKDEGESKWKYLQLERFPYGYEFSIFNGINICVRHLYGEYLNNPTKSAVKYYESRYGK